jgi:hypothetical protein
MCSLFAGLLLRCAGVYGERRTFPHDSMDLQVGRFNRERGLELCALRTSLVADEHVRREDYTHVEFIVAIMEDEIELLEDSRERNEGLLPSKWPAKINGDQLLQ